MTRRVLMVVGVLALASMASAEGERVATQRWVKGCARVDDSDDLSFSAGMCAGYVAGFVDALWQVSAKKKVYIGICIPDGVTTGQLVKVVVKYTEEHPEQLHLDWSAVVGLAFMDAFPCGE